MTIINPFKCEKCERELQPEDIGLDLDGYELVRICGFCGNRIIIKSEIEVENETQTKC